MAPFGGEWLILSRRNSSHAATAQYPCARFSSEVCGGVGFWAQTARRCSIVGPFHLGTYSDGAGFAATVCAFSPQLFEGAYSPRHPPWRGFFVLRRRRSLCLGVPNLTQSLFDGNVVLLVPLPVRSRTALRGGEQRCGSAFNRRRAALISPPAPVCSAISAYWAAVIAASRQCHMRAAGKVTAPANARTGPEETEGPRPAPRGSPRTAQRSTGVQNPRRFLAICWGGPSREDGV